MSKLQKIKKITKKLNTIYGVSFISVLVLSIDAKLSINTSSVRGILVY